MGSTAVAVLLLVVFTLWQVHNRRHPAWPVSAAARCYVNTGCLLAVLAGFWLTEASSTTGWEWLVGDLLLLAAVTSTVLGRNALAATARRQARTSQALESITDRDVSPSARQISRRPAAGG